MSVALFAEKNILEDSLSDEIGILKGGPWRFLGVQLLAVVAISTWSAITTFLELLLVDKLVGMRMTHEEELLGADQVEHGIKNDSPATWAWGKTNGQSNGNGRGNIAYQTEEGFERPQTASSRPQTAPSHLQEHRIVPIIGELTSEP